MTKFLLFTTNNYSHYNLYKDEKYIIVNEDRKTYYFLNKIGDEKTVSKGTVDKGTRIILIEKKGNLGIFY